MLTPALGVYAFVNVLKDGEMQIMELPDFLLDHHRWPFIPSLASISMGGLIVPTTRHDTVCLWDLHEILMNDWIKMARAMLPAACSM